jgi:RNA polymerase sigma factor (sigma-70 family)
VKVVKLYNSDHSILKGMMENDSRAYTALYDLCRYDIINYILSKNGNEDDAADIVQEVILEMNKKIKTGTFVLSSKLTTYLIAIAKYKWFKQLGDRGILIQYEPEFDDIEEEPQGYSNEQIELVLKMLKDMDEKCQEIIHMRFWGGKRYENIAQIIEKKLSAVKMRGKRCLDDLETKFKQTYEYAS